MNGPGHDDKPDKEIDDYEGELDEIRDQVERDLKAGEIGDMNAADLNGQIDVMEDRHEQHRDNNFPDENMDEDDTRFDGRLTP